ncbi:MAG: alpha/beta hydrolase [Fimbriimonadaceae bacterium]|nr:alpha/beta hydrolase [Fimbriimonadaceae bacterium]
MSYIHLAEPGPPGSPTLVMLHGTGGDEREFLAFGQSLASGVGFLSLRGKEPERGANRWFRRHAEGVFDVPNLIERADELGEYVQQALPDTPRIAVGFSNGANIAAAVLLQQPAAFDAALLLAPMVPYEPTALPDGTLPDLGGKPILMVCGEHDPIVPRSNAQHLATLLATAGADLQIHWHAGGHSPDQTALFVAKAWLARQKQALARPDAI